MNIYKMRINRTFKLKIKVKQGKMPNINPILRGELGNLQTNLQAVRVRVFWPNI